MEIKISLDNEKFTHKPEKSNIGRINNRIAGQICTESITILAKYIGEDGCSFCPAIFDYKRRNKENFREMQLFVLDFDDGTDYQTIKDKCEVFGLQVSFSYYTFSSTQETPKYRVVFCHQVPIRERWLAEMMLDMLKELFPETDAACFETARMFFGGKGVIEYCEKAVFSVDKLVYEYQRYLYLKDESNYVRNIGRIGRKYQIQLKEKGFMNICTYKYGEMEENNANPYKVILQMAENSSKIIIYRTKETPHTPHQNYMCKSRSKIRHVTQERLCSVCRLATEYFDGEELNHSQKFLLATNLIHMEGMISRFLNVLAEYNNRSNYQKWKFDLRYMQAMQYKPEQCNENCPYAEKCSYDKNICLTLTGRKRIRELVRKEEFVPIEKSYSAMELNLKRAIAAKGNAIHLIYGQTGLGKSYAYKNLMEELERPTIFALPTVKLKNEIAKGAPVEAMEVISLQELFIPENILSEIQSLYDRGLHREAKKKIREYSDSLEDTFEKKRFEEYLKIDEILEKKESHIIMTHARFLQMSEEQLEGYDIIIDEDILMTILKNTRAVKIEDVEKAIQAGLISDRRTVTEIKWLLELPDGSYLKSKKCDSGNYISQKIQDENYIGGNINDLTHAGSYHQNGDTIEYFVPQKLPSQKIIIMSATLNQAVYRLYFPERKIVFYDTPKAKYKGRLKQYTYYSMSRKNLLEVGKKYGGEQKIIDYIKKLVPEWNYGISFKKYDPYLKSGMHFGNAAGIDSFKGKNGIIIGTPHLNESSYKLIGCYLDIDMNGDSTKMRRQQIQYKGYEFNMMTYGDQKLREIQLYMISSELEQCIGRSRLLREDATVYLFSDFPCEQAELIQEDYLIEMGNMSE